MRKNGQRKVKTALGLTLLLCAGMLSACSPAADKQDAAVDKQEAAAGSAGAALVDGKAEGNTAAMAGTDTPVPES